MLGADPHHILHILRVLSKDNNVRRLRRNIGGGVAMLFANGLSRLGTIAETLLQNTHRGRNTGFVASKRDDIFQ